MDSGNCSARKSPLRSQSPTTTTFSITPCAQVPHPRDFEHLQDAHFPGQLVLMPDNPFCEEVFPDIQSTPALVQPKAISLLLSLVTWQKQNKEKATVQAEQSSDHGVTPYPVLCPVTPEDIQRSHRRLRERPQLTQLKAQPPLEHSSSPAERVRHTIHQLRLEWLGSQIHCQPSLCRLGSDFENQQTVSPNIQGEMQEHQQMPATPPVNSGSSCGISCLFPMPPGIFQFT